MAKKYLWLISIIVLIAVLAIPACTKPSPTGPTTPAPVTTPSKPVETKILKFTYGMPKTGSVGQGIEFFAQEFTKRTDGRYKVETYPMSSLVEVSASVDSLKSGVVEFALLSVGSFLKLFPLSSVAMLPTLAFPSGDKGVQDSWDAFMELHDKFPEVQQEFSDFKLLHPGVLTAYMVMSKKKEIHKPSDFKGLRVGGTGKQTEFVKMNGGAVVNQIPPQAYMNLDKGIVDAAFVNWAQILDYKLWEVGDNVYEMGFSHGLLPTVVNTEVYNSMSPEDQKLLHDIWTNEAGAIVKKAMVEQDGLGKEEAAKFGMKIIQPTPEERAVWIEDAAPIFDQWIKDADGLGAKNADKVLAEWKRLTK